MTRCLGEPPVRKNTCPSFPHFFCGSDSRPWFPNSYIVYCIYRLFAAPSIHTKSLISQCLTWIDRHVPAPTCPACPGHPQHQRGCFPDLLAHRGFEGSQTVVSLCQACLPRLDPKNSRCESEEGPSFDEVSEAALNISCRGTCL